MILFNSKTEHSWLSNFHPCSITFDGLVYPSVENYYQSMKCKCESDRIIFTEVDAAESRRIGKNIDIVGNWSNQKINIMKIGLELKFNIPELQELLLSTGTEELMHLSPWDTFWGVDNTLKGKNILGKQIEYIRNRFLIADLL